VKLLRRSLIRDVRARKAQFAAVAITILLGVALFGASLDAFFNLTASYEALYDETRFADVTAIGGPSASVAAEGGAVAGVEQSATRSVADAPIRVGSHELLGRIVGLPPDGAPTVNDVLVVEGTGLDPSRPDGILLEQHVASHFGLAPGDSLAILTASGWRDVQALGVVASPEYLWPAPSRQQIFASPDDFGVVFAPEPLVTSLPAGTIQAEALFRFAQDAPSDTADRVGTAALAAGAADTFTRDEQPSNAALQEDVSGFGMLSVAFPALFLGAAAFAAYILLGRLVSSQRALIGTLRASGFTRGTILRHYLGFGLVVGMLGAIPGVIVGALLNEIMTRLYTGAIGVPIRVVEIRPLTVVIGVVIGILAAVLAVVGPARHAAGISPAAAMLGPAPTGRGGVSRLERLVPPLRRLPARWLAVLRSIGRSRRRSLSTVGGVVLAISLILVSWGMIDTVVVLLDRQFVQVQRNDAQVWFDAPRDEATVSALGSVDGVAAAEPALEVPATIVAADGRYTTTLRGLLPGTVMHGFLSPGDGSIALPDTGLLVGAALRSSLGLEAGSEVTLDLGTGRGTASAVVAGFVDEPLGTFAYSSLAYANQLAGNTAAPMANSALIKYDPGADPAAVRSALTAEPAIVAFADSRALYDIAQEYLGLFYVFIGVMLVLGGIMAFALIYTTMSANIAERTGEIAAMRTLGMRRRTVARLATAENLLLIAIGIVPGLIVGYALAYEFMAEFSSDMFSFDLELQPLTLLLTPLAIVVVGAISQVPALRAIGSIDLGRVVRERSF
jgi:putative ABC transport system permease protein